MTLKPMNDNIPLSNNKKTRLLIVDDDPHLSESLEIGLLTFYKNYDVKCVHFKGDLQKLMNLIYPGEYDVLILDITMPKINGLEITKKLRSEGHNMPIILMTGFSMPSRAVESMRAGADDLLIKPFTFDDLVLSVNRALSYKGGERVEDIPHSDNPDILKEYYKSGELMVEFKLKNGKLNGVSKIYRKWGTPLVEISYDNGMVNGSLNWFNSDGKVRIEDDYRNNEKTKRKIYENDGNVKKSIKY